MFNNDRLLIDYLPDVISEIREYKALMYAEQPEVLHMFEHIQNALDNNFVMTCDEYGVRRWEKLLGITPPAGQTLEQRKAAILARLAEQLPLTYRMLENILNALVGAGNFDMTLYNLVYNLEVILHLNVQDFLEGVRHMLRRIIPANLGIGLDLRYNTHNNLKSTRHRFLHQFTHERLRTYPFEIYITRATHGGWRAFTQGQMRADTEHELGWTATP